MILPIDIKPEKSLYAVGADIINLLNKNTMGVVDLQFLYNELNRTKTDKISFNIYLFSLDWLFMIGLVELDNNANIKKLF